MWFRYVPRDLEWQAPSVFRNEAELALPPDEVFAIWADNDQWPLWFSDILGATWTTEPPRGPGSRREVRLKTLSVREEFLAWEPGRRFAFTMTDASVPIGWSIVEDYRLEPLDGGRRSRFVWEVRHDVRLFLRPLSPVIRLVFGRMFRNATAGLVAYCERRARASAST